MVQSIKKILCLISFMVLLTGCSSMKQARVEPSTVQSDQKVQKEDTEIKKKTIENVIKIPMDTPTTLHPIYNTNKSVEQTLYLLFDPLVTIQADGSVIPRIASSWVINDAHNTVTLTINNNIRWHDGTPLTSKDVAFTLETIKNVPDSAYRQAVQNLVGTEIVDDTTIKLIYKQPFSGMMATLFFPIIPEHIYNVPKEQAIKLDPVGSGPYKFESMVPLKNIYLTANNDYFKNKPNIEQVKVIIVPNQKAALNAFEQGLVDTVYTDIMEWGKYTKDKNSIVHEFPSNVYEFIGLNFNKPVFQNVNVRNALVYGLDREKIAYVYYLGHAVVTDTPISPRSYLYDKQLEIKGYDKEKTKLLLMQEGYQRASDKGVFMKNNVPLSFSLLVNKENLERVKVAKEIKKMYEEVGIQVTIEEVEKEDYLSRIYAKQYDAFLGGWQLSYATDLSFAFHSREILAGDNFISYKDEKMDNLLGQIFMATESTKKDLYDDFQKYFADQNPYVSLYFKNEVLITKSKIVGDINPTPTHVYCDIQQWSIK